MLQVFLTCSTTMQYMQSDWSKESHPSHCSSGCDRSLCCYFLGRWICRSTAFLSVISTCAFYLLFSFPLPHVLKSCFFFLLCVDIVEVKRSTEKGLFVVLFCFVVSWVQGPDYTLSTCFFRMWDQCWLYTKFFLFYFFEGGRSC